MKVLILDEPTSALTRNEVDRVFRVINGFRDRDRAIIFISHKMDEIFSIGDDYAVLRNGKKVRARKLSETDADSLIHANAEEAEAKPGLDPLPLPAWSELVEVWA